MLPLLKPSHILILAKTVRPASHPHDESFEIPSCLDLGENLAKGPNATQLYFSGWGLLLTDKLLQQTSCPSPLPFSVFHVMDPYALVD